MAMTSATTARQREVLLAIYESLRLRGYPPTVTEMLAVGASSRAAVQAITVALAGLGLVDTAGRRSGRGRVLRLVGLVGWEQFGGTRIPVYDGTSAGLRLLAEVTLARRERREKESARCKLN